MEWLNYANQGAIRNKPLSKELISALSFLPEMGVTMEVFSGGQEAEGPNRTGSHRHDHGGAADVFFYKDGRKLDWSNPEDVPIFQDIVSRAKSRGVTGFGAGKGYMQPGSMHIGFGNPAVWGAEGKGANAPAWLVSAYGDVPTRVVSAGGGDDLLFGSETNDILPQEDQEPDIDALLSDLLADTPEQVDPAAVYAETADIDAMLGELLAPELPSMTPPADIPGDTYQQPDKPFFDITSDVTRPSRELLSATGASIMGEGPSVVGEMLPEGLPGRETFGRVADIGLAPLAAAGLGYAGLVGAGADIAEAAGLKSADRLARDVMAMPEAFAGSPGQVVRAPGGRVPVRAAPAVRREPVVSRTQRVADDFAAKTPDDRRKMLGDMAYKASRGDRAAMDDMAALARVDPEAAAAADRLGINVPADVLGDNVQLDEIAGMLRTQKGSEASAQWEQTVSDASKQAYEIMRGEGGYEDIASVSDAVRRRLQDGVKTLDNTANPVFAEIEKNIPIGSKAGASNMVKTLNDEIAKLGGVEALTASERKILKAVTSEEGLTYARLERLRREIGKARFEGAGPYADADDRITGLLYDAVRKDMMDHVEAQLGPDARAKLENAFALKAKGHELKEALKEGFGKNHDGSIASLMTRAITSGGKGDASNLTKAMRVVPEDMRKDALLGAFDELSKSKRGPNAGEFSFQEFQKAWGNLERQSPVMAMIQKELGPKTFNVMRDLATVSKKIQKSLDQTQAAKKTGASQTAEIFADNMMTRFMNSAPARTVTSMAGGLAAGAAAGPLAGAGAQAGLASMRLGGKRAEVASQLFKSPEFQRLAVDAARSGQVSEKAVKRLEQSGAFKSWAKENSITNPNNWLAATITAAQAQAQSEMANGR